MRAILTGDKSETVAAYRDAVCLNTAAALVIADRAETLADGVRMAAEAMDTGRAWTTLEKMVAVSNS
jgi:anthranilate phosphoribosyltransferase